jgi:hypothetical protein
MINIKSSQVFLFNSLAVPRLENVQLRFHFLRRGTSDLIKGGATLNFVQVSDLLGRVIGKYNGIDSTYFTLPVSEFQKCVYIINVLDSEGKSYTNKLQR